MIAIHDCIIRPHCLELFCFFCEKAAAERLGLFQLSRNRDDAFITTGFRNWKKALQRFQEHAQSRSHQFAVERVAHHQAAQPVECQLSTQRDAEQREARCCLKVIYFTSIQYLARQGLALRGHTDSEGNFKQLLLLRCRDKPVMQRWLDRRTNMTSPQAQNEILQLMANTLVKSIANRVAEAKYCAVIVDGTQDASRKEQLALCLYAMWTKTSLRTRSLLACTSHRTRKERPLLVA